MNKNSNVFATVVLIIGLGFLCVSISQAVDMTPLPPVIPLNVPGAEKDKFGDESRKNPAEDSKTVKGVILKGVLEDGREIIVDTVSGKIIAPRLPLADKDTGTSKTSSQRGSIIKHDKDTGFNVEKYQEALRGVNQDSADRLRTAIDTYEQKREAFNTLQDSVGKSKR